MQHLSSKQIRQMWLDFWKSKDHQVLPSKSLIPINDPSLLWINSGVATLKDYFSGHKIPPHPRLTNAQKALRTNDIENVGLTARHHTFFEMLGNFAIGNYFKKEAIAWAYELLFTVFKFPLDKIYITYFEEDQETYENWIKLGIKKDHLIAGNKAMNFWDVGQGPCGPDTEIFYDRGTKFDPQNQGLKLLKEDLENDRYVEIWNIVFSQFNNDGQNNYTPLVQKNIDTGAGLERIVAIFQNAPTNFDTDLFLPIIKQITKLTNVNYQIDNYFIKEPKQSKINLHFRIIADHLRAITIAINDGAKPSNTQRGYIIRRLIRRAYRSGLALEIKEEAFLYKLVSVVAQILDIFKIDVAKVQAIIKKEELAFALTIKQGEAILKQEIKNSNKIFSPKIAFKLFETYGFPLELTLETLKEHNLSLDLNEFKKLQAAHSEISRHQVASAMSNQIQVIQKIDCLKSKFVGYQDLAVKTKVIFQEQENNKWYVLLAKTPFYATGGGQRADLGQIENQDVLDVFKDKYGNVWHILAQKLSETNVFAKVNAKIRAKKAANHSATHLLAAALVKTFGPNTIQLGSDNDQRRLTYDFPLEKRATPEKLSQVESLVNKWIDQEIKRQYILTTSEKAFAMGATALEGEEYGANVRVVKFNEIIDFCGGTHVENTKLIEQFKIIKFESRGTGVFRIVAITTKASVNDFLKTEIEKQKQLLKALILKNQKFNPKYNLVINNDLNVLEKQIVKAQNDFKAFNKNKANVQLDLDITFTTYQGKKAYINLNANLNTSKTLAITLREKYNDALIIIGAPNKNRLTLVVASKLFDAKAIFDQIALAHQGKGGGNNDFAMGSINLIDSL